MQCFICVFYLIFICGAHPSLKMQSADQSARSLFRDVIESLRIPFPREDYQKKVQNNEIYKQTQNQAGDGNHLPRRNDRIEMPAFSRYQKSLTVVDDVKEMNNDDSNVTVDNVMKEKFNSEEDSNESKEHIDSKEDKDKIDSTTKPKKNSTSTENNNRKCNSKEKNKLKNFFTPYFPWNNSMDGDSQIGDRKTEMVIKPSIILNFKGIREIIRESTENIKDIEIPNDKYPYIFNINQEVNVEGKEPDRQNFDIDHNRTNEKRDSRDYKSIAQIIISFP